jgi:tRNA A-37 threonylcarbamoyl transferase component Bud32
MDDHVCPWGQLVSSLREFMEKFGKYTILEKIGAGGMGSVYKARDPVIERDVAIKIISAPSLREEEARKFFTREARSAGRLSHENIVTIYDVGEEDGKPFLVMEMLEGQDLGAVIAASPPWPIEKRLDIVRQICRGLKYAHDRKVVHRDIKPGNIRVLDDGRVKILDFGIARIETETATLTQSSVGTPRYMSPEQVSGSGLDHRSDIFSFGVLLYELLTGKAPFVGENVYTVIYKILNAQPEPLDLDPAHLTGDLRPIVERCLQKDVDARYQSFGDVIGDLDLVMSKHLGVSSTGSYGPGPDETVLVPAGQTGVDHRLPTGPSAFNTGVFVPPGAQAATGARAVAATGTTGASDLPAHQKRSRLKAGVAGTVGVVLVAAGGFWVTQRSGLISGGLPDSSDSLSVSMASGRIENNSESANGSGPGDTGVMASIPEGPILRNGSEPEDAANSGGTVSTALQQADAARTRMNRARNAVYDARNDPTVASAFALAEQLRGSGTTRYESGEYAGATEGFTEALAAYGSVETTLKALEVEHDRDAASSARQAAEEARSRVVEHRANTAIADDFASAEAARSAADAEFGAGRYEAATRTYQDVETRYRSMESLVNQPADPPETPVRTASNTARSTVDSIKSTLQHAVESDDWSSVPKPLADYYQKNVSRLHRSMDIQEAMINIDYASLNEGTGTAELPVTLFLRLKQKGKDKEDAVAIDSHWILNSTSGSWQIDDVRK